MTSQTLPSSSLHHSSSQQQQQQQQQQQVEEDLYTDADRVLRSPFHDGELYAQTLSGTKEDVASWGPGMVMKTELRLGVDDFLKQQRHIFAASVDREQRVWASALFGQTGFVTALNPSTVRVQGVPHPTDPLFDNSSRLGKPVSLIAIDFPTRSRYRINAFVQKPHLSDKKGLTLKILSAYGNCPKYIQRRQLSISSAVNGSIVPVVSRATELDASMAQIIARADTFFVASYVSGRGADVSHRGGLSGFVRVTDSRHLYWPDYPGNGLFQTLGNLVANPRAGLLFLDFASRTTLQLTGTTRVEFDSSLSADGSNRLVSFEIDQIILSQNAIPFNYKFIDFSPYNPDVDSPVCAIVSAVASATATAASSSALSPEAEMKSEDDKEDDAKSDFPMWVQGVSRKDLTADVTSFTFKAPRSLTYLPGQYATFHLFIKGVKYVRTWTITSVSSSEQPSDLLEISVKRTAKGLASNFLHREFSTEVKLELTGISGEFTCFLPEHSPQPTVSERKLLFLTAGVGITPTMAFLRGIHQAAVSNRLSASLSTTQLDLVVLHSAKDPTDVPFAQEIQDIVGSLNQLEGSSGTPVRVSVRLALTRLPPSATVSSPFSTFSGRINDSVLSALPDLTQRETYVCGPEEFINQMSDSLVRMGLPGALFHTERFDF